MRVPEATPSAHAVLVREACKSLSDVSVLDNLNMTVPSGTVYSLLGASGSGKTTLLKCLVGALTLDSGEIQLGINSRSQLGYMPQETALYDELRVCETFQFFGRMLGVSDIMERVSKLSDLLHIPPAKAFIKTLSGGEKRRVSLAVALLQDPQLIILDEPTVGLDSLLRQSIWEHLYRITKEDGRTVLITTHYIEEASKSDKVSFLRGGRLLEEASPSQLMASHNAQSLDEVYVTLSEQQDTLPPPSTNKTAIPASKPELCEAASTSLLRVYAHLVKSVQYTKNNLMIFYTTVILPIIIITIWLTIMGTPADVGVGYVNRESPCEDVAPSCQSPLSCRYLRRVRDKGYRLVELSEDNLLKAVANNAVWASLNIYPNLTAGVKKRMDFYISRKQVSLSDWDEIRVAVDMSNYVISGMLKKDLFDSFMESMQDWYKDCGWNVRAAKPTIKFHKFINAEDGSAGFQRTGSVGLVVTLHFTMAVALGMSAIMIEEDFGTKTRCEVAGMRYWELVVSQVLAVLILLIPQMAVMMASLHWSFPDLPGGILLPTVLIFIQAIIGLLMGVLLSTMSPNLNAALLTTVLFSNCLSYLVGIIWPVEGLHWVGKAVFWAVPGLVSINTLIMLMTRGLSLTSPILLRGILDGMLWLLLLPAVIAVVATVRNR